MKAFVTLVMVGALAYLPATWAEETTPDADAYKASIMAFGLTDGEAEQTAQATVAAISKQKEAAETVAETEDVYSTISAAWLDNPYQIE